MAEKNYYDTTNNENIQKIQKNYQTLIQENNQTWLQKEKDFELNLKKCQSEIRMLNERKAIESQEKEDIIKMLQTKLKEVE